MNPRAIITLAAVALLCGCGSEDERAAPTPRHKPTAGAWGFVGAPVVQVSGPRVLVSVRTTRALPGGAAPDADVRIAGVSAEYLGLSPWGGVERCYVQELSSDGRSALGDRTRVRVALWVGEHRSDAAVARVERSPEDPDGEAAIRRLGCRPRPQYRTCSSRGAGQLLQSVEGGATCAEGRRVLKRLETTIDDRCQDLCLPTRPVAGFRCTATQNGEVDWALECRRGRQVLRRQVGF